MVCEDQSTEPAYFQQFQDIFDRLKPETLYLERVGTGRQPRSGIVEQAIEERQKLESSVNKEIDFVWVVFDKDDADKNEQEIKKFEDALELATKENMKTALSNECFELWLLLHLKSVSFEHPIPRQELYNQIENAIQIYGEKYKDFVYKHGKRDVVQIIAQVGNEEQAIKKAEKLLEQQKEKKPIEANPSTQVHLLVSELRAWIKFYDGD
ncbi:MAG: RloB domain-containing protein [Bacteroidia bacterium]|nr:RloB domain-containing protein [Bacteroidia bacterium]